ncbi:MAG: hypothetical protein JSV88_06720 [Candidatus Aminicenantes bacterium]|nr:MAG: hypothetical protein JSV88_06720 [Candidatus Aminicenantes bacterium]
MKIRNKHNTKQMPGKVDNYFIFERLPGDSIGNNYRAAELKDDTPVTHKLLTEVHPFLFKSPGEWPRINVLCERGRQSGNPNLCIPEKIIQQEDYTYMVCAFHNGKTLARIVEDVSVKDKPIPFDLAFSIIIAIATILEMGSSIVVQGQNAFHGFLTPDHLIVDYHGNIFLKYFGFWPLFDENEAAISEMTRKYGAWLAPEFIRKEKIVPQSDFYYLGYTLYRMLTGNYFSYLPGEDFESTFTSISFVSDLPSTDIEFLTTLINLFKKTLNPSLNKRFANSREFKNYISKFFRTPQDYGHFQSNLAAYMKTLYSDTMDEEEKMLTAELSQPLPEIPPIPGKGIESEIMEVPLEGIVREEKKRSKLMQVILILIIVTLAGGTYFLFHQLNKAKKEQQMAVQMLEQQNKEKKDFELKLQEVQQKLKTLEEQQPFTKEEQQIKDETISRLKKQENQLKKEVKARTKKITDRGSPTPPRQTQPEDIKSDSLKTGTQKTGIPKTTTVEPGQDSDKPTGPTGPTGPTIEKTEIKKSTVTPKKEVLKPCVPLVPVEELTVKPGKISGQDPEFPPALKKTYAGRRATVNARLLIDETGSVIEVKISDKRKIPADVRAVIVDTLKKWKYKPARKGNMKVRVWWPYKMKIHFRYDM